MSAPPFDTVLVANRGEIACRVIRSARALGYRTVAVYSDADADSLHPRVADAAVRIGPAPAPRSYLDIEAILDAARRTGAGAIHPGYGFLAEHAGFAEAVAEAGITFVGPPPEAIRVMGSKRLSKLRMVEAGVPCVPGYSGEAQDLDTLRAEAARIGVPLMIKASAGGGGRGLRLVRELADVPAQLELARAEAENAFGDGELILERAVERPRHVEIQVFADTHGRVVHLFERDCSTQRRHQKVIEEAPSPAVDPELRARMGAAAVRAATAIGYVGAGTVEMLLGADGAFHFMEMNTRLQVEHPVTEMITGLDLVGLQLDVAAGRPLPFTQDELRIGGHAIEARLYAEDPSAGFLPQTGRVERWRPPELPGVRVDHGLVEGAQVTADYDAMVAKIIAHGRDRDEARRRLVRALEATELHGVGVNRTFLAAVLDHPRFREGAIDTGFVEAHLDALGGRPTPDEAWALAAVLLTAPGGRGSWSSSGASGARIVRLRSGGEDVDLSVRPEPEAGTYTVLGRGDQALSLALVEVGADQARFLWEGVIRRASVFARGDRIELGLGSATHCFARVPASRAAALAPSAGAVIAPMAGTVVAIRARSGEVVPAGQVIAVLEAMKMQLELTAPRGGRVEGLEAEVGDQVQARAVLAEIAEATAPREEETR